MDLIDYNGTQFVHSSVYKIHGSVEYYLDWIYVQFHGVYFINIVNKIIVPM